MSNINLGISESGKKVSIDIQTLVSTRLLVTASSGGGKSETLRRILVNHKGYPLAKDDLGRAVNMESSGGTFSAYLSDLKQAGLIIVDRDGVRANAETLFL